jgi:hypothetical protein
MRITVMGVILIAAAVIAGVLLVVVLTENANKDVSSMQRQVSQDQSTHHEQSS